MPLEAESWPWRPLGKDAPDKHDVERNAHDEIAVPRLEEPGKEAQGVEGYAAAENGQWRQDPKIASPRREEDRQHEHDGK